MTKREVSVSSQGVLHPELQADRKKVLIRTHLHPTPRGEECWGADHTS